MGYMRCFGTSETAPEYSSNTLGKPVWSGLHTSEITADIEIQLKAFILYEAKLQGHNDAVQKRVGENSVFFHNLFLNGWPQALWKAVYEDGVADSKKRKV